MRDERYEEQRRRRTEADQARRRLLADAAARRAEMRARHAELLALTRDVRRGVVGAHLALREAMRRLADELDPNPPRKRRPRRPDVEEGGLPVSPDRPRNLSGGAAAALDFENE